MKSFSPEDIMQKVSTGKPFTLLVLLSGRPAPEDPQISGQLQMAHLGHLFSMEAEGKISVFGPVNNDDRMKGIIIFNTTNKEDIYQWMKDDPWIQGGYLRYELYDWFTIPGQRIPE